MWPKKSRQGFFAAKNRKHLLKLKYPEQVAEPESPIIVRIFLFDAVSFKKRYLPTAPFFVSIRFPISPVSGRQWSEAEYWPSGNWHG